MAMRHQAVRLLQEYKSIVLTSRSGFGFSMAVRQNRNGCFLPSPSNSPVQATLERAAVGPATLGPALANQSNVSSPKRTWFVAELPSSYRNTTAATGVPFVEA